MTDPHKPHHSDNKKPGEAPDISETDLPVEVPPEGQIPGLPISSDPLMQPLPRPANREVPQLD